MVTDKVKNGVAIFYCTECGAETTILKYSFVPQYDFPVIDHDKTISSIESFHLKHALCKDESKQLTIEIK
jgi:hypothetical protein